MNKIKIKVQDLFDAIEKYENHLFKINEEYIQKTKINIKDKKNQFKEVPALIKKRDDIIKITLHNGEILKIGSQHVICTMDWIQKKAKNLTTEDFLIKNSGLLIRIKSIEIEKEDDVFDLQINSVDHLYSDALGYVHHNTFIMSMICKLYDKTKILVLFNRTELLHQTKEKFVAEYGFKSDEVGIIGGGGYEDSCRITLLSIQSYQNIFHLFPDVKIIITDECHETGRTTTAEKIIYSCQSAAIKIGLSATVSVIENPYEKMKLHGNIGPIIHKVPYDKLRDMGTLATISVSMYKIGTMNSIPIIGSWNDIYETIKIKRPEDIEVYEKLNYEIVKEDGWTLARKFISYGDESNLYIYNNSRNELIAKICEEKERVLILFTKIAHGKELLKLIPHGILISGDDDRRTRESAKQKIKDDSKTVIIASSIFDVGVDIPAIKTLILAGSSVSNVRVMQKIGRATRKDLNTLKEDAEIIDFMQYDNPLSLKQSRKRKKIYEDLLKVPVTLI
jgi:superfamily II DNA or RNA helicase